MPTASLSKRDSMGLNGTIRPRLAGDPDRGPRLGATSESGYDVAHGGGGARTAHGGAIADDADDGSCARGLAGSTHHVPFQLFATFDDSGRRPARSRLRVRTGRGRTGSGGAPHAHRLARGDHADGRRDRPHPRHRARRRGERDRGRGALSPPLRAVLEPGGTYLGIQHLQGIARRPRLDHPSGRVRRAGARGGQSARPVGGRFGCRRLPAAARSAHHTSAAASVDRAERSGPLPCRHRGDARGHAARRQRSVRGRCRGRLGNLGRFDRVADRGNRRPTSGPPAGAC